MRPVRQIRKRDGRLVPFRREKIADAIFRAARAVGGEDRFLAEELSGLVVAHLQRREGRQPPTIEDVQDLVEKVLIETGHARTAKAYILYRERRTAARAARSASRGGARLLVGGEAGDEARLFSKARLTEVLLAQEALERTEAEDVARAVEERLLRSVAPRVDEGLIVALVRAELFDRGRSTTWEASARGGVPPERIAAWLAGGRPGSRASDPEVFTRALGEDVLQAHMLQEALPRSVAEAHRVGDLSCLDLGTPLAFVAAALPLDRLLERHLDGDLVSRASGPRRIAGAFDRILACYRPFVSRCLALEDLNVHLAPYVSHLDEDALSEEVRQWLLAPGLAAFPARGGRLHVELGLRAEIPPHLRDREPLPPAPPGQTYGHLADVAHEVARVLVRETTALRRRGGAPGIRLTLVLPRQKPSDAAARALVREALAAAAEVGEPLVVFEAPGALSRGSRWLRRTEAQAPDPLRFEGGDVALASVTSVNLVAAALRTRGGDPEAFLAEAERLGRLAVQAAAARRDLLARAGEGPDLPLYFLRRGPVPLVDLDGALHGVELVGVDRALALLAPASGAEDRAVLARRLDERLRACLAQASSACGLEALPVDLGSSEAAGRFARLDALRFPEAGTWWAAPHVATYAPEAPPPGEVRREPLAASSPRTGGCSLTRVRHRVDAEHRPCVDDLLVELEAAADDARVLEYALEPWPHRWLSTEGDEG